MTPETLTVYPHELEPGDIIVEHLGLRVGGYDPPSLLLYNHQWWVWSSTDKLICILPADVEVEVLRTVAEASDALRGAEPIASATPDDCDPHGLTRVRHGLYVVTP